MDFPARSCLACHRRTTSVTKLHPIWTEVVCASLLVTWPDPPCILTLTTSVSNSWKKTYFKCFSLILLLKNYLLLSNTNSTLCCKAYRKIKLNDDFVLIHSWLGLQRRLLPAVLGIFQDRFFFFKIVLFFSPSSRYAVAPSVEYLSLARSGPVVSKPGKHINASFCH